MSAANYGRTEALHRGADGTGVRDYIHVVDLAKGPHEGTSTSTTSRVMFQFGTGVGYSVLDMLKAFGRRLARSCRTGWPAPAGLELQRQQISA